jgi:hypothetical protein
MSRRRSRQPAISLFSFQDIVTSVTAILILVVLILTLELISQKYREAATDGEATAAGVADAVAEMESLAERLEARKVDHPTRSVAPLSPEAARREERILGAQVERVTAQLDGLRRVHEEADRQAKTAEDALRRQQAQADAVGEQERDAERLDEERRELNASNAAERERLALLERTLEGRPPPGAELVFNRPRDGDRQSWLLEVSDRGFSSLRLGTGRAEPLGIAVGEGSRFDAWVGRLTPRGDYVLILARPSGLDSARAPAEALEERGIPHGLDFIGEGQTVHDGSEGPGRGDRAAESERGAR